MKHGITAGIGLFIAFIGLKSAGVIVGDEVNLVGFGDMHEPMTLLSLAGLFVTLIMMTLGVRGALFFGMVFTAFFGWVFDLFQLPDRWVTMPPSLAPTLGKAVVAIPDVFSQGLYAVIFAFLLVTLFDTTGTMIGVAEQAKLMKNGTFPRMRSALLADAVGMTAGAAMGTSPTSAYIESSSGVAAGGRTGLHGGGGEHPASSHPLFRSPGAGDRRVAGHHRADADHRGLLHAGWIEKSGLGRLR